jgi:hypothetical protein
LHERSVNSGKRPCSETVSIRQGDVKHNPL